MPGTHVLHNSVNTYRVCECPLLAQSGR